MNILFFIQGLQFGGLEKMVCDLAINLKRQKNEVIFCCYDELGFFHNVLKSQNIQVHYLKRKQGIDIHYPFKLASLIKNKKVDIIHAHNATAWFYAFWASILSKIPLVYTEHDRSFPTPLRLKFLHYFFGKYTHAVVAVSKAVKHNLEKYEHIKNIKVIYNGIDPILFYPPTAEEKILKKKQLGLNADNFVLGNVGRMDYWKNQRILIEILPDLKKVFPNIKLVFVGGGDEEDNLKKLALEKKVENDVLFLGKRCDVNEILKAFDLFVFPSLTEGLPLVVIEAMATGLPIIASPVGGIPELIIDDKNGFLVSPTSKSEIKSAIIKLIENQDLRIKMGQIGRKIFESNFSLPQMVRNYLKIYENLLERKELGKNLYNWN